MDLSALNILADAAMMERQTEPEHAPIRVSQGVPVFHPSLTPTSKIIGKPISRPRWVAMGVPVEAPRKVIKTPKQKSTLEKRVQLIKQIIDIMIQDGCSRTKACVKMAQINSNLHARTLSSIYSDRYVILTAYRHDPKGADIPSWLGYCKNMCRNKPISYKGKLW